MGVFIYVLTSCMVGTYCSGIFIHALANVVTENIDCPETIQLHATSSFRIIDGHALVVALGKPDADVTRGDLADTYVKTVLKAGSEYHRMMLCSTYTGTKQSRVRPEHGAVKQHVQ